MSPDKFFYKPLLIFPFFERLNLLPPPLRGVRDHCRCVGKHGDTLAIALCGVQKELLAGQGRAGRAGQRAEVSGGAGPSPCMVGVTDQQQPPPPPPRPFPAGPNQQPSPLSAGSVCGQEEKGVEDVAVRRLLLCNLESLSGESRVSRG